MDWLEALVLGIIQGVTEFLPISSDGHLAVATQVFAAIRGTAIDGASSLFFNVMLHLGTLAAILLYYREPVGWTLRGALGAGEVDLPYRRPALLRTGILVALATLPAVVVGLLFKDRVEAMTADPRVAAAGFLVTAAALGASLRMAGGSKGPGRTTRLDALLIGSAQALAMLPGVSRSGMTIVTALGLGLSRAWAVGFSLIMAVPAILGAATLELTEVDPASLTRERILQTIGATFMAGLVGYGAIAWLIRIVHGGRLWYFSVYLVVLAGLVVVVVPRGGQEDAGPARSSPLDGPARVPAVAARPGFLRPGIALPGDRPVERGPGAGALGADPARDGGPAAPGVDLGRPVGPARPTDDGSAGTALRGRDPGRSD